MSLVSSHLSAGASGKQEVKSVFRFTILLGSSDLLSLVCWEQVCGDGVGTVGLGRWHLWTVCSWVSVLLSPNLAFLICMVRYVIATFVRKCLGRECFLSHGEVGYTENKGCSSVVVCLSSMYEALDFTPPPHKKLRYSWACYHMPLIPALKRLRWADL